MPEIIETPFRLYQDDPVISVTSAGVADTWTDIWKYQVPIGVSLIIKPEHTISIYLDHSTGSDEMAATAAEWNRCMVKVEKRDASGSDVRVICGPKIYRAFRNFTDKNRLAHFNVPPEGVIIGEREFFVIVVNDSDDTFAEGYCYFEARIAKVRKAIGA